MTDTNPGMTPELSQLLLLVAAERRRQDDKFGPQDYPLIDSNAPYAGLASAYKQLNDRAIKNGTRTGDNVLLEEVYEALSADGPEETVTELVQVAAVALLLAEMEVRRHPGSLPPVVSNRVDAKAVGVAYVYGSGQPLTAARRVDPVPAPEPSDSPQHLEEDHVRPGRSAWEIEIFKGGWRGTRRWYSTRLAAMKTLWNLRVDTGDRYRVMRSDTAYTVEPDVHPDGSLLHDPHPYVQEVPSYWGCRDCDYGPEALHHKVQTADPESPMSRQEVKNLTAHTRYGGPVTVDQTSLSTNSNADLEPADWGSNAPAGFPGPEPYDQGGYYPSDRSAEQDD